MASQSFRESMNTLGWSRRDPDLPANTHPSTGLLSTIQSYNPFNSSGSLRLPTDENPGAPLPARTRREEEEAWFTRKCLSLSYRPLLHTLLRPAAPTLPLPSPSPSTSNLFWLLQGHEGLASATCCHTSLYMVLQPNLLLFRTPTLPPSGPLSVA